MKPKPSKPEAARGPSPRVWELTAALALLLACLGIVLLARAPGADPDLWARMATGKLVLESGQAPHQDPFSYTPKKAEWIDHEWGAGVVFYLTARAFGQAGLVLLKVLLLFGTVWFMYRRAARAAGGPPSVTFHALMAAALMFGFVSTLRSQTFTFFFFSLWFHLLERARDGDWRLTPLLPLTTVLWANLHGGFLSGIGLIVMFAVTALPNRRLAGRLSLLAAGSAAASAINPYGGRYWNYLFEAVSMDRPNVLEWTPIRLFGSDLLGHGFRVTLVFTLLALGAHALQRRPVDRATLLPILVTMVLGLSARRHVTFFVIAAAPFVWSWLAPLWNAPDETPRGRKAAPTETSNALGHDRWLSRGLIAAAALFIFATTPMKVAVLRGYPVGAVDFIRANGLKGNLLIDFNVGSYGIWRLYPDCRVALDGRFETVYTDATFKAVSDFYAGRPGWSRFLDAYPHDILLIPRILDNEQRMKSRPDWVVAYSDEDDLVYVKADRSQVWRQAAPHPDDDPFETAGKPRYVP